MLPVDVNVSTWDSAIEGRTTSAPVRLGFSLLRGMREDVAGQVNVILWPGLLEKFRKEALGASLLAVYGVWQAEGKVRHLIASKLVDRTELLGALPTTSREFC